MKSPAEIKPHESCLTEDEVIQRFMLLETPSFDVDYIDLPSGSGDFSNRLGDAGISDERIDEMLSGNSRIDLVGTKDGVEHRLEAKGGKHIPYNASKELGKVVGKNITLDKSVVSGLVIPRDRAHKVGNRLSGDNTAVDCAGVDGYKAMVKAMEKMHDTRLEYKVYLVWNEVTELSLTEFLDGKFKEFEIGPEDMEDLLSTPEVI